MLNKTLLRKKARRSEAIQEAERLFERECLPSSQADRLSSALAGCVAWLMSNEIYIDTLEELTRERVIHYGKHLNEKFCNGEYVSTVYIKANLNSINSAMLLYLPDNWNSVSAKDDCGIEDESLIPKIVTKGVDSDFPSENDLAGYLLELQKSLGVSVREALELDLNAALQEGRKTKMVSIASVTTGAIRKVPCTERGVKAIAQGIASRRLQRRLPKPWSYDDFLQAHKKIARRCGYSTNTARSEYVKERYRQLTGINTESFKEFDVDTVVREISTISSMPLSTAKGVEKKARRTITMEIGELGLEQVTDYLGKQWDNNER